MYINTQTLTQHTESEIRALYPNTSFSVPFTPPDGYAFVQPAPQPAHDAITQRAQEVTPVLTGFGYQQTWEIVELFAAQVDKDAAIEANRSSAKAAKWEAIKVERDRRKALGYFVGGKWFHGDTDSRIQQIGLLMMGANIPVGMQWKTLDGSFVVMTPTLAAQIFNAAAAQDQAIFSKAEEHRVAMEASADPAAYDFSGGWPAAYVE